MRNIRKVLLLAMLGILGCKNGNVENENATNNTNDTIKTDTVLVLGKACSAAGHYGKYTKYEVLVADKNGNIKNLSSFRPDMHLVSERLPEKEYELVKYTNVGDTVIVAHDKKYPYIIKNLTMENKAKAFSKHR